MASSDWARVGVGETGEPRNAPSLQAEPFWKNTTFFFFLPPSVRLVRPERPSGETPPRCVGKGKGKKEKREATRGEREERREKRENRRERRKERRDEKKKTKKKKKKKKNRKKGGREERER